VTVERMGQGRSWSWSFAVAEAEGECVSGTIATNASLEVILLILSTGS
jgi:hypothetical protein